MTDCHLESTLLVTTLPARVPSQMLTPNAGRPRSMLVCMGVGMPEPRGLCPYGIQLAGPAPGLRSPRPRACAYTLPPRSPTGRAQEPAPSPKPKHDRALHHPSAIWAEAASRARYAISCCGVSSPGARMPLGCCNVENPEEKPDPPVPGVKGAPRPPQQCRGHRPPWLRSLWPAADRAAPVSGDDRAHCGPQENCLHCAHTRLPGAGVGG